MSTPTTLVADRYRLVKLIGSGGMGVVWQAWDERLHRAVALKMLRTQPELTDEERDVATKRAMREARISAGLHHPHAVPVFDVVAHEGQPCLVMQLIESTPLSAILREHGALTPPQTARIGAEVASALAAAHARRIVHCDVKPGNILIRDDGSAMISDFGISHALGDASITATGMVHGTPAYLAPEVARGDPSSFASDVFSLGSTMYAMLEGAPPFGADPNAIALLHKVARGTVPAPRRAGELEPLLRDMLSTDPKLRPDMPTVAARLAELERGMPGDADVPVFVPPRAVTSDEADAAVPDADDGVPTAALAGAGAGAAAAAAATGAPDATPTLAAETRPIGETAETERLGGAEADTETKADAQSAPSGSPDRRTPAPLFPWMAEPDPQAGAEREAEAEADPPTRRRRVGGVVSAIVVVALLVVGGGLLYGALRPDADPITGASVQPTSAPSETSATPSPTAASPTPTPTAESTPTAEPEPSPEPEPTAAPPSAEQRIVDTLVGYYGLLPGDRDSAWPRMTADYRINHVGGRAAYDAFWGNVVSVSIADVDPTAPDRAQATLTYTFADGRVAREITAYRFVDEGGVLKIAATEVLSSTGG